MNQALARASFRLVRATERPAFWLPVCAAALVGAAGLSAALGAVDVPPWALVGALFEPQSEYHTLIWEIRVPRIAVAALVGCGLAISGALMQTVVRNPLADPGLLGVTAGAGVGALTAILFLPGLLHWLPVFAFAGALAALSLVLFAAAVGWTGAGPLRLILSGVALQAVLFSAIALLTFFYADRAPAFVAFTVGSLGGSGWREVTIAAWPVGLGLALALAAVRPANVLLLDDDTAQGVGLPVYRTRVGLSCLAAWLAAAAVSVAGLVGFVGLVVPNAVRIVLGPDHRSLLPLAALAGAALVVLADLAARIIAAPLELPVGALLAFVGGPWMLYLLWRQLP